MLCFQGFSAGFRRQWESKGLCVGALAHDRASHVREGIGRYGRRPVVRF